MNTEKSKIIYNIDTEEIAKFKAMASCWWDLKGDCKFLHRINPLRLNYITERSYGLCNKNVLDIGCGGGILAESMARKGAIVTGLDVSFEMLQIARLHALESGLQINYIQETVEEHETKYIQHYDIVTCMEVLEHVPDPKSIVNACAKLIKPEGHVFFSTINRNCKSWFLIIIIAEYILQMIPKGTHDVKKFIRPTELLSWINHTCLKERHIIGLHYNLILDKFKLDPGINVNYILHTTANK